MVQRVGPPLQTADGVPTRLQVDSFSLDRVRSRSQAVTETQVARSLTISVVTLNQSYD